VFLGKKGKVRKFLGKEREDPELKFSEKKKKKIKKK